MRNDNLLQKVKEAGFETIDDFVKANLHYLSKDKQELFYRVACFNKPSYQMKESEKKYSHGV